MRVLRISKKAVFSCFLLQTDPLRILNPKFHGSTPLVKMIISSVEGDFWCHGSEFTHCLHGFHFSLTDMSVACAGKVKKIFV